MARHRRETFTRSFRRKLCFIMVCSPYCGTVMNQAKEKKIGDDTTMPSRKFSVNSQLSSSSMKTSGSSSNGTAPYRKAASIHQINELYAALNELIYSPPSRHRQTTGDSFTSVKTSWSSESNLLDFASKKALPPRANSEASRLRPARSTSCLSSKSCFASIATNATVCNAVKNSDTSRNGGIYSKLVAKLRGKKGQEKQKSKPRRKSSNIEESSRFINEKIISSIDDLIELANSKTQNANRNVKGNAREKRGKFKAQGRSKANSFDSCEANSTQVCVHRVSSKLRTWYTRAASLAATIEDETRSRAESSFTNSTENFLESSSCDGKLDDEDTCEEAVTKEELPIRDFDASSADALAYEDKSFESFNEKENDSEFNTTKRTETKVTSVRSELVLKRSYSSYDSTDDVFLTDGALGMKMERVPQWKSDDRCDLIRRLSLNIVEDVLASKSASCDQITKFRTLRLNRDMGSKRKVQQWLKDLHKNQEGKANSTKKNDSSDTTSSSAAEVCKNQDHHEKTVKEDLAEDTKFLTRGQRLPTQPLFYIPNLDSNGSDVSLKMIINF